MLQVDVVYGAQKNVNLINDTQLLVKMGHGGFMNASAK